MADLSLTIAKEASAWISKWFQKTIVEGVIEDSSGRGVGEVEVCLGNASDQTTHNGKFILEEPGLGKQQLSLLWEGEELPRLDQLYLKRGDRLQLTIRLPFLIEEAPEAQETIEAPEPKGATPPPHSLPTPKTGDWACGKCGYTNFASRGHCRQCQQKRQNKSRNIRRAGDWSCQTCGYTNFATRSTCRDCGRDKA